MSGRLDAGGRLLLVGAGKMGGAMLRGWLGLGLDPGSIAVIDPHASDEVRRMLAEAGIALNPDLGSAGRFAVAVLAVKPQAVADALPPLAPAIGPETLVISIMAGRTLAGLASALGEDVAIVRAMPNTPAAIGRGITAAVPNARVSAGQHATADALLKAAGAVEWVDDEDLIDAVTAVSGSGPAYVFHLVEALAEAGADLGLPEEQAMRFARATVIGAGELLRQSPESAATLREHVTSPAGTTAAALSVLMAPDGLASLMKRAVQAACRRSRELAG